MWRKNQNWTIYKCKQKMFFIQIIDKLKQKAICGFDDISTKLIKLVTVEPLTAIINPMLNTGIFPDLLKIAKITYL